MITIWKFAFNQCPTLITEMPRFAKILTAADQRGDICLWVEVDTAMPKESRMFEIFGTGHEIPESVGVYREYISTVSLNGGTLIFHVYERRG